MVEKLFLWIYKNADGSGNHYIVDLSNPQHVEWLHQKLGICPKIDMVKSEIEMLKNKINVLEQPLRIAKLKQLLASEKQGRTERWIRNRIPELRYDEIQIFVENRIIERFMKDSPKFRVPLYRLAKEA